MKKVIFFLVLAFFGLAVSKSFAVSNNPQYVNEGETYFEKVGATGASNTGNPGYVVMTSPNTAGVTFTYYLWVNGVGKLCMASYPTISAYTSFPTGNWNNQVNGMGCTVVGSQS